MADKNTDIQATHEDAQRPVDVLVKCADCMYWDNSENYDARRVGCEARGIGP